MSILKRPLKVVFLTLLAYLIDVCVMPRLMVNNVSGSASFAMIAVLTVAYGRKSAFVAGALIGILLETMLASVSTYYLILYPVIAMLGAQVFADMTERQRERRRTELGGKRKQRRQTDLPPALRTMLCAGFCSLLLNAANGVYSYISGFGYTFNHIARSLTAVLYTMALSAILMAPVRLFLGLDWNGPRREKRKRGENV